MRVPYFTAKDKDSDQYVQGFYAEFPETSDTTKECKIIHAIMVVVPNPNTEIPMMPLFGIMGEDVRNQVQIEMKKLNALSYCTIDINTLQQIGEVEIGGDIFNPNSYIKTNQIIV